MLTFAIDYFLLVFIATTGVVQIGASLGRFKGLLIFKPRPAAWALGLALVVGAFVMFFGTSARNLNDYAGGLDAPSQGLFFFLGASAAIGVTFALSSMVNMRMKGGRPSPEAGLDALREANYVAALRLSLSYWLGRYDRRRRKVVSLDKQPGREIPHLR